MSKNVSVKEGNVARKFRPVDRLNVVTDNEQQMWKPESAFKLGTLNVSENGIYIASLNGYAAYSEINVRVTDKKGSDDPSNYDYIDPDGMAEDYPDSWDPSAGDIDGINDPDNWKDPDDFGDPTYSVVDPDDITNPKEEGLYELDENGNLVPTDDTVPDPEKVYYKEVDPSDLEETGFDPFDPEESTDDFDPSSVDKVKDIKLKKTKTEKVKGIDPDTGKEKEVTATEIENEDGELETLLQTEELPDHIHIVVPPRKRNYYEGETIDFSGIHVYLMDNRHKRFTCPEYPTGEIPFDELVFPVTVAEGQSTDNTKASLDGKSVVYSQAVAWSGISHYTIYGQEYEEFVSITASSSGSDYMVAFGSPDAVLYVFSKTSGVKDRANDHYLSPRYDFTESFFNNHSGQYTHNGETKIFYFASCARSYHNSGEWNGTLPITTDLTIDEVAKLIFEGEKESVGDIQIPVQWMRSDGETLEDTFTIEIVSEEEEETGGEEQPQSDPFVGYADISSNGHFYNINRKKVPQIHYANGYVWQEGISTEYSVEQAASLGLIILVR